jgi:hypothetical protein
VFHDRLDTIKSLYRQLQKWGRSTAQYADLQAQIREQADLYREEQPETVVIAAEIDRRRHDKKEP